MVYGSTKMDSTIISIMSTFYPNQSRFPLHFQPNTNVDINLQLLFIF
jgi:hypothetical protein